MRQRWLGATGVQVPEIAVEGELELPDETLVLDSVHDTEQIERAHAAGMPVVVRAQTAEDVRVALARPEVACALVPPAKRELVELDLTKLTYG